ncbi:MAG: hypothetical protein ABH838_04215, partial [Actinomycetota bacterium]
MSKTWDLKFVIKLRTEVFSAILEAIDGLTETLKEMPLPPAARARMERLNIIRAIRGTTGIEGNRMTEDQVAAIVDRVTENITANEEEQENINARDAMRFLQDRTTEKTPVLDEGFIKELHEITTKGIRSDLNTPGKYRREVVYAGIYEFPDPKRVPKLMKEFISFINSNE